MRLECQLLTEESDSRLVSYQWSWVRGCSCMRYKGGTALRSGIAVEWGSAKGDSWGRNLTQIPNIRLRMGQEK